MRVFRALLVIGVLLPGCISAGEKATPDPASINSFEECVKAGYPIMRSMPAQCAVPDGRVFVDQKQPLPPLGGGKLCREMCGDGTCQQIVCMGEGCPCSESPASCPKDCK